MPTAGNPTGNRKWTVQLFDGAIAKDNPPVLNKGDLALADAQAEITDLLKVGDRLAAQPLIVAFIPPTPQETQEQPSPLGPS
ncbi:MAG: hypothetical protein FJZ89_14270 [Chloroflexi bacterium]|nr:hypothetical protein [Chloroflexota bacterium]